MIGLNRLRTFEDGHGVVLTSYDGSERSSWTEVARVDRLGRTGNIAVGSASVDQENVTETVQKHKLHIKCPDSTLAVILLFGRLTVLDPHQQLSCAGCLVTRPGL